MKQKPALLVSLVLFMGSHLEAQVIEFNGQPFELHKVTASVSELDGHTVMKVERDLKALPFDEKRLEATVDEPTFVKLKGVRLQNGVIEVKMLSRLQEPLPFIRSQGFIGVAFRINEDNSAYESIYLRPRVGRSANQSSRNRTVQYYSYPRYKFDTLRKIAPAMYETTAPIALNEWITYRLEIRDQKAELFINDAKYSTFVVNPMKGQNVSGGIALWVDIGTVGYFKDLKVMEHTD